MGPWFMVAVQWGGSRRTRLFVFSPTPPLLLVRLVCLAGGGVVAAGGRRGVGFDGTF